MTERRSPVGRTWPVSIGPAPNLFAVVVAPPVGDVIIDSVSVGEPDANDDVPFGLLGLGEEVTVYWVVIADGAAAPSAAQIIAGQDSSGAAAIDSGSFAGSPGGEHIDNIDDLADATYQAAVVLVDGEGNQSDVYAGLDFTIATPPPPPLENEFDTPANWFVEAPATMADGELNFPGGATNFIDVLHNTSDVADVTGGGTARVTINPSVVVDGDRFQIQLQTYTGATGDGFIIRYDTSTDGAIVAGVPIVIDEPIPAGRDGLKVYIRMHSGGGQATFDNCTVEML